MMCCRVLGLKIHASIVAFTIQITQGSRHKNGQKENNLEAQTNNGTAYNPIAFCLWHTASLAKNRISETKCVNSV